MWQGIIDVGAVGWRVNDMLKHIYLKDMPRTGKRKCGIANALFAI
jgi:hypothetical protein